MENNNFGSIEDYISQSARIKQTARMLRGLRPTVEAVWDEPADWVVKESNIAGKPAKTLSITLTPTGCEWAQNGGCTMCGEYEGSTKGKLVPAEFHVAQFAAAVSKYVSSEKPVWLRIYQEGNFINDREIDSSAQEIILKIACMLKGVKKITVESMAKYITPERAGKLRDLIVGDVELEVGMGFEGQNNVVRNVCVNKGEPIIDFQKAVRCLRDAGLKSVAYVLLKPPFLTEQEAIDEAVETIKVASEVGFDAVSLEPVSIHGFSLVHALNSIGCYDAPWLWSILEVAKQSYSIEDLRIGGRGYFPRPWTVAHNRGCSIPEECNETLWRAITEYGRSRDVSVFDEIDCTCRTEWENDCKQKSTKSLKERIDSQLNQLDIEEYRGRYCVQS